MSKNIGDIRTIDSAGRVAIPAGIRKMYGYTPGKHIGVSMTEEGVLIKLIDIPED